jgi:hypothetical protein
VANIVNDDAHLIKGITFIKDRSIETPGEVNITTGMATINVREILSQMLGIPLAKRFLSLRAEYVLQVIETVAHEGGHLYHKQKAVETNTLGEFIGLPLDQKEAFAEDFGRQMLLSVLEKFNIEPTELKDEPYLAERLSELFITRGGDELFRRERRMLLEGSIYEDEAGRKLALVREFMHHKFASGRVWRQETFPVRITFTPNEKGEVKMYEADMDAAGLEAACDEDTVVIGAEPDAGVEGSYFSDEREDYPAVEATPMATAPVINTVAVQVMAPVMSTGLKLPPHIAAAMQANAAGAAAVSQPKAPSNPQIYTPNNYPGGKLIEFMTEVYKRVYFHTFNECGWTGTPGQQDWHFADPTAVIAKPVSIVDIIHQFGMPDVVMAYNTHDAQGRKQYGPWAEKCQNGIVRGEVFKKTGLPAYTFYCNFYGNQYVRKLIPENTMKDSSYGSRARSGECLAWVIADEKKDDAFLGHFANGVWVPKNR